MGTITLMDIKPAIPTVIAVATKGIQQQQVRLTEIAHEISSGNATPENLVEMNQILTYTKALLKVIETETENTKRLIDIV